MRIDGRLDEAIYEQRAARLRTSSRWSRDGGQPATEKTEVWVFYDDDNVYVSFRAWESQPDRMIANEMRRDSSNIRQGDSVEFAFDTFRDRRNAILFEANALGAPHRSARARTNGSSTPTGIRCGRLSAGRFEGGWTIEAAVPFKSIRYAPGTVQDWGFQARRIEQVEERDRLPDQGAAGARARPRRLLGVALRQPGRPRSAAACRARSS